MKVVEAKLVSASKDSKERRFKKEAKRAQVIVCLGEGSERHSATRHVVQQNDGSWIGRNPDEQTEKLHIRADGVLLRAENSLRETAKALEALKKANKDKKLIAETEKRVADYEYAIKKLGEEKEQLNRDYPLTVQFKF